jgi:hypothetical protein
MPFRSLPYLAVIMLVLGASSAQARVYAPAAAPVKGRNYWCSTCSYSRPLPPKFVKNPPRRDSRGGYRPFDHGTCRNPDMFMMGRRGNRMHYGYYRKDQ